MACLLFFPVKQPLFLHRCQNPLHVRTITVMVRVNRQIMIVVIAQCTVRQEQRLENIPAPHLSNRPIALRREGAAEGCPIGGIVFISIPDVSIQTAGMPGEWIGIRKSQYIRIVVFIINHINGKADISGIA